MKPYGTVSFRDAVIEAIERRPEGGFRVSVEAQPAVTTRFLILATGMRDIPLDIPGYEDYWGKSLLHCNQSLPATSWSAICRCSVRARLCPLLGESEPPTTVLNILPIRGKSHGSGTR